MEPRKKKRRVNCDRKMHFSVDAQLQMILKKAKESKSDEEKRGERVELKHVNDVMDFDKLFNHYRQQQEKNGNDPIYSKSFDFYTYRKYYDSISSANGASMSTSSSDSSS